MYLNSIEIGYSWNTLVACSTEPDRCIRVYFREIEATFFAPVHDVIKLVIKDVNTVNYLGDVSIGFRG